jgi:hypothetical protein
MKRGAANIEKATAVRCLREGLSAEATGRVVGRTGATVRSWRRDRGVKVDMGDGAGKVPFHEAAPAPFTVALRDRPKRRDQRRPTGRTALAVQGWLAGLTAKQIQAETGLAMSGVYKARRWLK